MGIENIQTDLFQDIESIKSKNKHLKNGSINKLQPTDRPFHDWYRFVLSYPPHLVRHYIEDFKLQSGDTLLDPFCGTGTTLIEARLHQLKTIGIEANPVAHFAASTKTCWDVQTDKFIQSCEDIASIVNTILDEQHIDDLSDSSSQIENIVIETLSPDAEKLLLKNSISPLPLHKALVLLQKIRKQQDQPFFNHALLALAKTLVFKISNLKFGPEVGVGKIKKDAPVVWSWLQEVKTMARDLDSIVSNNFFSSAVHLGDARQMDQFLKANSINAVITSPPYPNEKDYTRTTRLESVILGFMNDKSELRAFKKTLVRSNTRSVYVTDDDDQIIEHFPKIIHIAEQIEKRRIELGKTSGFERTYARVTKLYFGGMYKHLQTLSKFLKPGAQLAYVVGDQASYLRVMIRTGELLVELAESLGYEHVRTDLFRTRLATATGEQLREEVVILKWLG